MTVFVSKGTVLDFNLFYFIFYSTLLADHLESSGMAARPLLADQLKSSGMAALFSKRSRKNTINLRKQHLMPF